ncbi:hypothetical protein F4779DRAFT_618542 [Xylariaceae sp. FL0662B]|nr:hypothetical protein F4779DRAFT_618542 [Xylariaceae sp. FL0662B]
MAGGKTRLPTVEGKRPVRDHPRRRHRQIFAIIVIIALEIYALYNYEAVTSYVSRFVSHTCPGHVQETTSATATGEPVPLEAHIMSKCPDARVCLEELVLPAMMRVNDKVNFTLSYIGTPTENDGVHCKHGPSECMGNIIELCAHHLYPDPKIYLGFTMCLTKDYEDIPERDLVEGCALEYAIDFEKLNECAVKDDGAFGLSMLRQSIQRTASV